MTAMTNPGERDHCADLLLDIANRIEPAFPEAADELRTLASTPGETHLCAEGHRWVRWKRMERRPWRRDYGVDPDGEGGTYAYYVDIAAVRVLSEGVS